MVGDCGQTAIGHKANICEECGGRVVVDHKAEKWEPKKRIDWREEMMMVSLFV
jgi:hypothetical protein